MLKCSHVLFSTMLLLVLWATISAQYAQPKTSPADEQQTRQVIGSASGNSIRFSSLGELIQLRLEVIGSAGETLFDSDFRAGNVIDWSLSDKLGRRLPDGSYLCIVTVKDSSGKTTRKHVIATLREQVPSLSRSDSSLLSPPQSDEAGSFTGEDVTIVIDQSTATAVLAHDGSAAQIVSGSGGFSFSSGDFFANKILEHMRITAEGNIGIGTQTPQARLDVDGLIRASRGIVYPDGTIQLSASSKTLGARSLTADQASKLVTKQGQEHFEPQATGTGTLNFLAKWTETGGVGMLGNSGIIDVNGSIGIGTNNPQTGFDYHGTQAPFFTRDFPTNPGNAVAGLQLGLSGEGSRNLNVGPSFLFFSENSAGAKSFLGRVSGIWENPAAGSEAASIFFQVRANSGDLNALTERMRITSAGNVGIGTSSPQTKLEVFNGVITSSGAPNGGRFLARNPNNQSALVQLDWFNDGTHDWPRIRYGGANEGAVNGFLIQGPGEATKLALLQSGFVGIGTTTPDEKLEVSNGAVISTGASGGRFTTRNPNNQGAFAHFDWFNDGTHDWPRIRYGGSGEGGINGFLLQGPGEATKLAVLNNGNVGIGTTTPGAKLEVFNGVVTSTGSSGGRFLARNPNNQSALVQLDWFNDGTHDWPRIRYGGGGEGSASGFLLQGVNDATKLAVLDNGKVGIGTITPQATLHVVGNGIFRDSLGIGTNSPNATLEVSDDVGFVQIGNGRVQFSNRPNDGDSFLCYRISNQTQPVTYVIDGCGSSIRLKKNINSFNFGLSLIKRLRPVSFDWKSSGKRDIGLIAEEVDEVEPLLATHNDKDEAAGVKYEKLPIVLINAVKEQQAQIDSQQKQIAEQKRMISAQQKELQRLASAIRRVSHARSHRKRR